jgi:hypothetical protein
MRMCRIYGHKWTSAYGETDDGTWLKGMSDITPEQVAHGLSECLKRQDPWPPTLPEFRAMAKPNTPAYHKPFPKMLSRPWANEEVAEKAIGDLKKIVRKEEA